MEVKIEFTRRLCRVGNRYGLFHTWEFYSQEVMALSPTLHGGVGGPPRRDSQVFALVEFEDAVERVDPSLIRFCDEDHDFIMKINEIERRGAGEVSEPLNAVPVNIAKLKKE